MLESNICQSKSVGRSFEVVALANFLNLSIKIKILQEWNSRSEPFEIKNRNKYQSMHNPIAPNVKFPLRH